MSDDKIYYRNMTKKDLSPKDLVHILVGTQSAICAEIAGGHNDYNNPTEAMKSAKALKQEIIDRLEATDPARQRVLEAAKALASETVSINISAAIKLDGLREALAELAELEAAKEQGHD